MRNHLLAAGALVLAAMPAEAATLSKTYSYFSVGGATLSEIEGELARKGPHVQSTGSRHPGATTMEFTSRISYAQSAGSCRIAGANVKVGAKMTLPRWRAPRKADQGTRLIWNTLSADIKRHEESHVVIAKNHAAELEAALRKLGTFSDCKAAAAKAQDVTTRVLALHDAEQARFDRVEGKNFESRILRLLAYRLERMETARVRK